MKKYGCLFLSLLLLFGCLSGCKRLSATPEIDISTPFIGFAPVKTKDCNPMDFQRVQMDVIDAYSPQYAGYGVSVYYDSLTSREQAIYRIFLYALDQGQSCLYLDARLLEDLTVDLEEILCCLAMDNPLLEQNLKWSSWSAEYTFSAPSLVGGGSTQRLSGQILEIPVFSGTKLEKKIQAIQKGRQILAEMPDGLEQLQQAEYLYRYLGNHVEYFTAEEETVAPDYLYDALCVGRTNCDGFANAYSLLCSLAGICCMEKMYTSVQADEVGHTWNAIYLDGVWYNVDATAAREAVEEDAVLCRFGFSDALLQYSVDSAHRVPACPQDLIPPDCTVTNVKQAGKQISGAYKTIKKTGRSYVIALFPNGAMGESTMQQVANALQKNISTRHYLTRDGAAIYYIFPE